MNIAIVSVFNVSLLEDYVYPQYKEGIRKLDSNFTPAVSTLTLELLRKGETIIVFTQDIKARKVEEFHGDKVHVYVAPRISKIKNILSLGWNTPFAIKRLFPLHQGHIDVVSAHWTRDYAIAAKEFFGKAPVFVTVRDIMPYIITQIESEKLRWRMIWLKNEYVMRKKGYLYIANSDYTAHEVKRYWGHDIPVIPNSVAMPEGVSNSSVSQRNTQDHPVVTSISLGDYTDRRKNIPTLLKAFSIFRQVHPDAVLNLVGPYFTQDNPVTQEYRNAGLMDGVVLMGKKTPHQLKDILKASTMMVHPSLEETFGNTLIESLAYGVPAVGGIHSGAVPWVLEHGRIGYLCDVASADDMAASMMHIIDNYDEAIEKGALGREKCLSTYSVGHVADEYLRLFKKAIDS